MNDEVIPKHYKLKELPIGGGSNFASMGELQQRVEHLERLFNLLKLTYATTGEVTFPDSKTAALFEEVQDNV